MNRPCTHCGILVAASSSSDEKTPVFCCLGCQTVYGLLNETGLGNYYNLKSRLPSFGTALPGTDSPESFAFLDDPETRRRLQIGTGNYQIRFFLEGVHCPACLWLIERFDQLVPHVVKNDFDLSTQVVRIEMQPAGKFSTAAQMFQRLGFKPHPLFSDEDESLHRRRENRRWLLRIGIAAVCTGNIMLMTVPLYGGVTGIYEIAFSWISGLLMLPIVAYAALPFYRAMWAELRQKRLSIDFPISLAIVFGSLASYLNLFLGKKHLYFDTLATLTFLLLSARFLLLRIQQHHLSSNALAQYFAPSEAYRVDPLSNKLSTIFVSEIRRGDVLEIPAGTAFPADGSVCQGKSTIHAATLTGESAPQPVDVGSQVYFGTNNLESNVRIAVTATGNDTRIGKLLNNLAPMKETRMSSLADRAAQRLLAAVLVLSIGIFFVLRHQPWEAFNRVLALLIITCPCALALAVPLVFVLSLKTASRCGIIVKKANIFETFAGIKNLCFDKTGTLTTGTLEVINWEGSGNQEALKARVAALEKHAKHPIGLAIARYGFKFSRNHVVQNVVETQGIGIAGTVDGQLLTLQKSQRTAPDIQTSQPCTTVDVIANEQTVATLTLSDTLRSDSKQAIEALQNAGLAVFILSGDHEKPTLQVGNALGIPQDHCIANASPEHKKTWIQTHPQTAMIGDGANDAAALSFAPASIAVQGSLEVSLRVADVYIRNPGISDIPKLLTLSRKTMRAIRQNLIFSLSYNAIGIGLALLGFMNPYVAAILMPISSISVLGLSVWNNRRMQL